jgi:preprotein translocase subunit SecD
LIIPATPAVTGPGGRSCTALVTASDKRPAPPAREEVIFDRKRENCYMLGPALLTGDRVDEASAVYDDQTSQWVAIVLDGVVQAAPEINPGITGHDVQISGDYSRSEATAIAASLR